MRTKIFWPLAAAIGLALGANAHADGLSDTATAALRAIPKDGMEHAGAIYSYENALHVTEIHGSGSDRGVTSYVIRIPRGSNLVAIFHNHPAEGTGSLGTADHSEWFSAADVAAARALNVPSFVAVEKTGQVIRYTPGDRLESLPDLPGNERGRIARGVVVSP